MKQSRRSFLATTLAGASLVPGRSLAFAKEEPRVSDRELVQAAEARVLAVDEFKSPVKLESIQLFRNGKNFLVRVRSTDGVEGFSVPNAMRLIEVYPFFAALALGRMGPEAAAAIPLLIAHLEAPRGNCETIVAIALWRIEQRADRVIPVLVEVLHSESAPLRRSAAHAFCELGPAAKDARPALTLALTDRDRWVRKVAAEALERIAT